MLMCSRKKQKRAEMDVYELAAFKRGSQNHSAWRPYRDSKTVSAKMENLAKR